jgi:DNA-3-methyladenine glycosylase I
MKDSGIVRNRLKILSSISNARLFLEVQREFGTFSRYAWSFVGGRTQRSKLRSMKNIPATSAESDAWAKDMKRRGFKFCGSTILYAHMQATGMVDDHLERCWKRSIQ